MKASIGVTGAMVVVVDARSSEVLVFRTCWGQ